MPCKVYLRTAFSTCSSKETSDAGVKPSGIGILPKKLMSAVRKEATSVVSISPNNIQSRGQCGLFVLLPGGAEKFQLIIVETAVGNEFRKMVNPCCSPVHSPYDASYAHLFHSKQIGCEVAADGPASSHRSI